MREERGRERGMERRVGRREGREGGRGGEMEEEERGREREERRVGREAGGRPQAQKGKGQLGPEDRKAREQDSGAYHFPMRLEGMRRGEQKGRQIIKRLSLALHHVSQPRTCHCQGQGSASQRRGARAGTLGLCPQPQASGVVSDMGRA